MTTKTTKTTTPMDSQRFFDAAGAADQILREVFGLEIASFGIEKALDPLKDADFVKLVNTYAAELAKVSGPIEAKHVQAAIGKMDVDWGKLTVEGRRKILTAANAELRKATPRVVAKVSNHFDAHMTKTAKGTRTSTKKRFKLKIESSFNKVDQRVVTQIAKNQGLFVTNQYGRLHKTFSAESKKIVASGLEQGLRAEEITADLSAAARKHGTLRTGDYWRVLASAYTSRVRSFAQLASYNDAGIKKYRFEAVLDERTTEECRFLHGKVFAVKDGLDRHRDMESLSDPADIKSITPWIRTRTLDSGPDAGKKEMFIVDKDGENERRVGIVTESAFGKVNETGKFKDTMSLTELYANGISEPPLHGLCRSTIVPEL